MVLIIFPFHACYFRLYPSKALDCTCITVITYVHDTGIDSELLETVKSIADQVKEINGKIDNNTKTLEKILTSKVKHL